MNELNLKTNGNQKTNSFGIVLTETQRRFLQRRLEELQEKCPSNSTLKLNFEQRTSCVKGTLRVNGYSANFNSMKVATDPIQTFFLLKEDIEAQLLEWKRNRFSNSLYQYLSPSVHPSEYCA
jgi:hypothetical protein